jgi:hypothetical protein
MFKNPDDKKHLPTPEERQKLVRDAKLILLQAQVLLENLDSAQTSSASSTGQRTGPASLWSLFGNHSIAEATLRLRN